ncbi:MAG: hypothetical protein ACE5JU_00325 [Candidatus Binatia bacterium]
MKKSLNTISSAVSSLLLTGLFVVAAAPARAGTIEERIKALEEEQMANSEELARLKAEQKRLKGEQMELTQDALAAKAKLPSFRYRPGRALRIRAADKSWELRIGGRLMLYSSFFLDDNEPKTGTVQGAIHVRRFRPLSNFFWNKGFYELKFQIDTRNAGSRAGGLDAFDAEMVLHFEKLNPWLPYLHVGNTPSTRINPQDTNCSSKRCGRSERTFINEGAGITTGSLERGLVLFWRNLPLWGPAQISFFNVGYGIDRFPAFSEGFGEFENDSKSVTVGIGIKPFVKLKNKWLRGMELSFGGVFQKLAKAGEQSLNVRANQVRFARVRLIGGPDEAGQTQYYSPGLGWKIGPYQLRVAGQFYKTHADDAGREGNQFDATGFRILHELWLWSARGGFLTGGLKNGGFMFAPMYQRGDVRTSGSDTLKDCAGCRSAHAVNAGIGLWYYFPGDIYNVGLVWDNYRVNKARGGSKGAGTVIESGKAGRSVNFNTLTFVSRFHF